MSKRHLTGLLCVLGLLLPTFHLPASQAGDEADDGAYVVRLFEVGALTTGTVDYISEIMGTVSPDLVSSEDSPLFGTEGEEPILPLGTIDELMEIVKENVEPVYWQISEGADIRSMGERIMVVRASKAVGAKVAAYLAGLERDVLTTATVEVRAVRAPEGVRRPGLDVLLPAPGLSVTVTALVGQRAAARTGTLFAYVEDYDVEVAEQADASDPIVGVANWGLAVSACTVMAPETKRLRVTLDARLAVPTGMREHVSAESRVIELPAYESARLDADLLLTPGEWQIVQGNAAAETGGRWMLLVRATVVRAAAPEGEDGAIVVPSSSPDAGPLVSRRFDVSDLGEALPSRRGWGMILVPSNYTPPEPPELAEPAPLLPEDALPDLIRELVAPGSWKRDGTGMDVRYGLLFVTNTEKVLDRVEAFLELMRRLHLWSIDLEARVYEVPAVLGRHLVHAEPGRANLLDEGRRQVLDDACAAGEAREVDSALVTSLYGARNTVFSGRLFSYVQDFEVEVAAKATTGNPVVQCAPEGVEVDLQPVPTSTGDAVNLAYQVTRTQRAGDIRHVRTPFGPIEAPALDILRLRGNLLMPLGETAVLGGGGDGERMLVVLVRPVLEPYAR